MSYLIDKIASDIKNTRSDVPVMIDTQVISDKVFALSDAIKRAKRTNVRKSVQSSPEENLLQD